MSAVRIQTGDTEPIRVVAVSAAGTLLTGLTDVEVQVWRLSSGVVEFFDWSDDTFKAFGSVVTLQRVLLEVSAAGAPGEYHLNTTPHLGGFNTGAVTNSNAGASTPDNYFATAVQTTLTNVANLPAAGEITEGGFVDALDVAVSTRAAPGAAMALTVAERAAIADAILTELVSDHETALNGSESVADTLALIRKRLFNALELSEGSTGNWVLKDDGGGTLRTYDASDKSGNAIVLPAGAPAKRTKAV